MHYQEKFNILADTLKELKEIRDNLTENPSELNIINQQIQDIGEEIFESKIKLASSIDFNYKEDVNMVNDIEILKNKDFYCQFGVDIDGDSVVEFNQEFDNLLTIKIKDYYSISKAKSLVNMLQEIISSGKFFEISLTTYNGDTHPRYNLIYNGCKIIGFRFYKSTSTEKMDKDTIYEVKVRYQNSRGSTYIKKQA